ncbi:hypothetical protein EUTSA_v10012009mg, partial [Eutrema salsugineum]
MRQSITDLQQQVLTLTAAIQQLRTDIPPPLEDEESDAANGNPFAPRRANPRQARIDDNRADNREDTRWESIFKLEIPEFHGTAAAEELLDWLVTVEEIMEFKRVPLDRCAALIASRFRGRAAAWWKQLKSSRAHN